MEEIFNKLTKNDNMKYMPELIVKNLVEFKGHEGESLLQGDLFLGNKKLGFISQDAWSGPLNIHISEEDLKPIEKFIKDNKMSFSMNGKEIPIDVDFYLETMLCVAEIFKKKGLKNV